MLKKIAVAAFLLLLAVAGYFYTRLDSLVKLAVESYGPKITKTSVTLRGVRLSPFSGEGRINGLIVGSPAGFKEPEVLSLGSARVAVDPKSVLGDVVVVHELAFEAPEIHYEREKAGDNLGALEKNVETSLPASSQPPAAAQPSKPKRIRIERFSAKGGKVFVDLYGAKMTLPLPDVTLDDIGGKNGVEPKDAAQAVLAALKRSAVQAVESSAVTKNVQQGIVTVQKQLKSLKGLKLKSLFK